MNYFKPGDKVRLTKAYANDRKDLVYYYQGILIVSSDKGYDGCYKVYRKVGRANHLPADDYRFELANPIWLTNKGVSNA